MSSTNQRPLCDAVDNFCQPYDKSYELSGKIMLSAILILFFVVIMMVCLHLYARWNLIRARRRSPRRNHLVFHVDANSQQASRGLDAAVLRSLPVFVFAAAGDSPIECAVCLSEFEDNESGRRLPKCGHSFHTECIDMWFHSHATCPLCRSPVEPPPPPPSSSSSAADPEVWIDVAAAESAGGSGSESGFCSDCAAEASSSSVESRRKKPAGVSIEVPARNNGEAAFDSPASQSTPSFRSPMSRMLSFTRILSRERRNGGVLPSGSGNAFAAANELDIERGKEATQ